MPVVVAFAPLAGPDMDTLHDGIEQDAAVVVVVVDMGDPSESNLVVDNCVAGDPFHIRDVGQVHCRVAHTVSLNYR